jgi:hypothetical protein
MKGSQESLTTVVLKDGLAAQDNHNTHGSLPESWATPRAGCPGSRAPGTGGKVLEEQVKEPKAWATPRAEMDSGAHRGQPDTLHSQMKAWATPATRDTFGPRGKGAQERKGNPMDTLPNQLELNSMKLNPRWVETLMGLPVGWTMPSCQFPVTIGQTSCASLAME